MCGIVGIFDTRGGGTVDRALLERMNQSQFHRGPDEGGIHVEPGVGFGHRRLSIIDLSSGQPPLYNALLPDGHLSFSSELKALMTDARLTRHVDPHAVEDYFAYGYVPEPKTIYTSARKLPPAHTLTLRWGAAFPAPREYWDIPFKPLPAMDEREAGEELIARLREAVKIRLISEVPLGAFLSGGVDSSAVVAMMAEVSEGAVNTCSISFGDPAFNEAKFAAMVAERYRTHHYVDQVEADDYDLIDTLAGVYDEPYADSSALPTYRVCQLARKHVTVVLSGDGGDENLAGYRRYRWHLYESHMRGLMPAGVRQPLFGLLGSLYPKADWAPKVLRAKTTFEALARDAARSQADEMVVGRFSRSQIEGPRGQIHFQESFGTVSAARCAVSAQDGFLGAARRLIPGAAAPACARRGPGSE